LAVPLVAGAPDAGAPGDVALPAGAPVALPLAA
jgi:hypothetical protein